MSTPASEERRTWFPLVLAGGFVAFALAVAFFAYAANREGRPEQASSVDAVSLLAIEAVDRADPGFADELACGAADLTGFVPREGTTATRSEVKGDRTGSFRLTVGDQEWTMTVGRDGERSCLESVQEVLRTPRP